MYDLHSILIQLKKEDTPLHGVMVRCVRCFYQWLDPTLWEGSALFELWAQELELIYGNLRQRLSCKASRPFTVCSSSSSPGTPSGVRPPNRL